jgi:hypothetical protein
MANGSDEGWLRVYNVRCASVSSNGAACRLQPGRARSKQAAVTCSDFTLRQRIIITALFTCTCSVTIFIEAIYLADLKAYIQSHSFDLVCHA